MAYINDNEILFSVNADISTIEVDQSYNPESENAQSGKAVAQAIENIDISDIDLSSKMDKFGEVYIDDVAEDVVVLNGKKNFRLITPSGHILMQNNEASLFINGSDTNPAGTDVTIMDNGTVAVNGVKLVDKDYVDDSIANIDIGESITVDQTYNPESENAQSGIAVEQAVRTKIDDSTIKTKTYTGLKELSIENVSGNQNIDITLSTKNLLLLPYDNGFDQVIDNLFTTEPVTKNGVTFKPNADGSITIWGTCMNQVSYYLRNYYNSASKTSRFILSAGNYTMSVRSDREHMQLSSVRLYCSVLGTSFAYLNKPLSFIVPEDKVVAAYLIIPIDFSVSEDNPLTVYPQIEKGNEVTPFTSPLYKGLTVADTPTFEGTNLTISEVGKDDINLSAETGVVQATVSNEFTVSTNKQFYIDLDVKTKVIGAVTNKIEQTASTSLGMSPLNARTESLNAGEKLTLEANMCKKNKQLTFYAKVDTMGEFILYHGKEVYNSGVVIIDGTNVTVKTYSTSFVERFSGAHGLDIADYIGVILTVDNSNKLTVKIITGSGVFEKSGIYWSSSQGEIGVESTSAELSNVSISWNCDDYKKPVWIYGDSYLDFENKSRWCTWMRTWGFDNCLAEGYPGATSKSVSPDFVNSLNHGTPKYAVWCLGMNDKDTNNGINTNWLECAEQFIAICEEKGIEPILATIPNTPIVDNSYKNNYVRSSGYRYIDFAAAVGAETYPSNWYDGLLNFGTESAPDKVHPNEAGAKALAIRALTDVPELMQK